jgi:hypothetical protein
MTKAIKNCDFILLVKMESQNRIGRTEPSDSLDSGHFAALTSEPDRSDNE